MANYITFTGYLSNVNLELNWLVKLNISLLTFFHLDIKFMLKLLDYVRVNISWENRPKSALYYQYKHLGYICIIF